MIRHSFLPVWATTVLVGCGPSVASIHLEPSKLVLTEKGRTAVIKADPKNASGASVVDAILRLQWSTSNPEVATVDNGVVTAVSSGQAKITASVGKTSGTIDVTVSIPAKLTLEPPVNQIVGVGKELTLTAKVTDDAGQEVIDQPVLWSTSDTKIVNVDDGKITTAGVGGATIRASLGNLSATASVSVTLPPISRLEVLPPELTFEKPDEASRLMVTAFDAQNQPIKGVVPVWTSSDPRVATVTETGQVRAIKRGKAKIKASAGEQSAEASIVVK